MVIVIIIIIIITIINIVLIIIIIAIICINIVNIGKMSFTSLYIQLGKSLALTIGPEKELLFLGSVNYSVDEVLILPDRSWKQQRWSKEISTGNPQQNIHAPKSLNFPNSVPPQYQMFCKWSLDLRIFY